MCQLGQACAVTGFLVCGLDAIHLHMSIAAQSFFVLLLLWLLFLTAALILRIQDINSTQNSLSLNCTQHIHLLIFISAQCSASSFLPRDAMRKRGLWLFAVVPCSSVYLSFCSSVRLSRWCNVSRLLSRPDSSIIPVFDPSAGTQFQGEPFSGGAKHGVGKFCDFRLKSPFIS